MATAIPRPLDRRAPLRVNSSCDFVQALMKLQRAAQLITSTLDLDRLLDRVVNDIADSLGCVEVLGLVTRSGSHEMVLHGCSRLHDLQEGQPSPHRQTRVWSATSPLPDRCAMRRM